MKNILFFGLHDVLIRGKLNIDMPIDYLKQLSNFCNSNNKKMFLITGMDKEIGNELIYSFGLDRFFDLKNIIHISKKYKDSLSELDKKLRLEKFKLDKEYSDSYYKVFYFNNEFNLKKEEALFVGHDIWTDAFYLRKYTNIDFVLLDKTLSNNNIKFNEVIDGLNIIKPSFDSFKDYLTSNKSFIYSSLDNYASKQLHKNILGSLDLSKIDFSKIIKKR